MADTTLTVSKGSDLLVDLTLEDANAAPLNLSGASVAIWGASHANLASALSVSVKSPASAGVVQVKLTWSDALAALASPVFRVLVTAQPDAAFPAGQRSTTLPIRLRFA